jgi:CelD/BcsL family acetyltransferase involved in cellulose biosynthesis
MADNTLQARTVSPRDLTVAEIAAWEHLSATVPHLASPFLSVHYARAVAATGIDVRVCIIYCDGHIHGFLPYQLRNRVFGWVRAAEPVGAAMTDYVGLIAEPGLRVTAAVLLKLARLNYLGFTHLDESQLAYGLSGQQPRTGLRIRLDQSAEQPLEALLADSPKYRKDTERRARQVVKEVGPIRFELDARHERHARIDQLIARKRAQYQRTAAPDALEGEWKAGLLHALSDQQHPTCRGLLSTMFAGDEWLAIHFGIIGNGVLQYWLPVYNPAFSKYAPGRLLIHHIIEASRAAGIHTIDRGEGDTASKRELANEEHLFLSGAWHNRSICGSAARGFQSLKWRFPI